MNKKGFTLIELLAVIVILAIIALIAFPTISDIVEKSKKGGAESSALGWIDAVEKQSMVNELSSSNTIDLNSRYSVSELIGKGVKVKGQKPSSGYVTLTNGKVSSSTLCIGNYKVVVEDNKVKSSTKENNCTVDSSYPSVVYSRDLNKSISDGDYVESGKKIKKAKLDVPEAAELDLPLFQSLDECYDFLKIVGSDDAEHRSMCVEVDSTSEGIDYKTKPDSNWKVYLRHNLQTDGRINNTDICVFTHEKELCVEKITSNEQKNLTKSRLESFFGSIGESCQYDKGEDFFYCPRPSSDNYDVEILLYSNNLIQALEIKDNDFYKCGSNGADSISCELRPKS